jgi:hypothetical protein
MSDLFYEDDLAAHRALVDVIKSWKIEVIADSSGKWAGNALRFSTREEADAYGTNLYHRWVSVRERRSVPSGDAVNARWGEHGLLEKI